MIEVKGDEKISSEQFLKTWQWLRVTLREGIFHRYLPSLYISFFPPSTPTWCLTLPSFSFHRNLLTGFVPPAPHEEPQHPLLSRQLSEQSGVGQLSSPQPRRRRGSTGQRYGRPNPVTGCQIYTSVNSYNLFPIKIRRVCYRSTKTMIDCAFCRLFEWRIACFFFQAGVRVLRRVSARVPTGPHAAKAKDARHQPPSRTTWVP